MGRCCRLSALFFYLGGAVGGLASPAVAATITVTTTSDELNTDGDCSLREALRSANLNTAVDACAAGSGDDHISVPAGTYSLTRAGASEDAAVTGDLDITGNMSIAGAGATQTIVRAAVADRVFHVTGAHAVMISDLSIRDGDSGSGHGGGVYNAQGLLTLRSCVISDNDSGGDGGGVANRFGGGVIIDGCTISDNTAAVQGGGLHNSASMSVTNSTVSGNSAVYAGGGISHDVADSTVVQDSVISGNTVTFGALGGGGLLFDAGGTGSITRCTVIGNVATNGGGVSNFIDSVAITDSTISGNTATGAGGGVYNIDSVEITNSTISGNIAGTGGGAFDGGGLYNFGSPLSAANLSNVTITDNHANGDGGGVENDGGIVVIRNTIIADNEDVPAGGSTPDCGGEITSQGYNLIGSTSGCTFTPATGDLTGLASGLAALAQNGGPTATHALLPQSPAIDAGNPARCADEQAMVLSTDQRGAPRPLGAACDIGAFELDLNSVTTTTTLPPSTMCTGGGQIVDPVIVLGKLGGKTGDEKVTFKGLVALAAGAPAGFDPAAGGLQILIEDRGAGGAPVFDLTWRTSPIPPGGRGSGCNRKDGWKGAVYKNKSNALDPPACTAGSANGLKKVKLKAKQDGGIRFVVKAKKAAIGTPVGPLSGTIVLGADAASGASGSCASHAFETGCIFKAGVKTLICK
jgi:CSLREA domain-containing protein